ncbi:cytochrome P450 [Polychaeton citri CBS 116435]|uniref:Cytochrome P450 n=1 Tax=Polychaeton citri CBS 116435 TaxID=1314669 RepID=A0A9P4Q531_9PEZI|nr:cytochrome P450 [Polychaeton citri CBS 116435]
MAFLTLTSFALLTVAFVLYKITTNIRRARELRAFAIDNGCEEPHWGGGFISGLKRFSEMRKQIRAGADILDDLISREFEKPTTKKTVLDATDLITTMDPANLQAMLATQFTDFETGKKRAGQFGPIMGKSIFTSDGPFWEHSRALLRPQFVRDNINDLDETDRAASLLIEAALAKAGPVDSSGWTPMVDLQPLFYNFTLDTATHFLFGESVDSLSDAIKSARQTDSYQCQSSRSANRDEEKASRHTAGRQANTDEFQQAFATVSDYLLNRIRFQSLYWTVDGIAFRRAISKLQHFTSHFVQRAVDAAAAAEKSPSSMAGNANSKNLLYALATRTKDRVELRSQTIAVLFAGRDTTAGLLGWAFLRLAQHRDIYASLRREILSAFPADQPITFAQLKSCRPLQHFLNEVLRLHPTVPFNNRIATRDTTLPVGGGAAGTSPIVVTKGQTVAFSVYFMHRRKDLWGEDALEFKPERWERRVPAWQFLPFSGGPRICLGQQYAVTEASYVLVRFLREFEAMEPVGWTDALTVKKGVGLVMWPGQGVRVRFRKAATS